MSPLQTAILRHTTTDGRHHFDWLLANCAVVKPDERNTLCWRCPRLLTTMAVHDHMVVEALSKHRGLYLRLNSPRELDGNRGMVEPIAQGWAHELPVQEQERVPVHMQEHAQDFTAAARLPEKHAPWTKPHVALGWRKFILRFQDTPTLCVILQGDQLTRVDDCALIK